MNQNYYNELSKIKTIDEEKLKELYTDYSKGDESAMNKIIEGNLRLVVFIAKKYYKTISDDNIISMDDLISEGNIGLITAANKFELKFGVKFNTYAYFWIKNAIQESIIKNENTIRIPSHIFESERKIHIVVNELIQSKGIFIKSDLEDLGLFSKNEIFHYFNKKQVISIDEQFNVKDNLQHNEFDEGVELKRKITLAIKYLKPKERLVIKMIFGIHQEPKTPSEICLILNVTKQRISQIKVSALKNLKTMFKDIKL